mmetsp:Transcript_4430/g.11057  ORF Transcript_4430/g.11057 Transcript_4430/m.11057 type:complete len:288 (+) Transcript_4430:288-1151(+)
MLGTMSAPAVMAGMCRFATLRPRGHAGQVMSAPPFSSRAAFEGKLRQYPVAPLVKRCVRLSARPVAPVAASADSGAGASDASKPKTIFTLPTVLTILRVLAIPVLIAGFYWESPLAAVSCTAVFIVAALTDFLDGYLARKMNASTPFGAFLDPVADKLMVAAVLILLCTKPISVGPFAGDHLLVPISALAIIGREITMSALREWAAALGEKAHKAVAVNNLGKWKTATQMVSLSMLLYTSGGTINNVVARASAYAGPPLLIVATLLTVWSLVVYFKGLWPFLTGAES